MPPYATINAILDAAQRGELGMVSVPSHLFTFTGILNPTQKDVLNDLFSHLRAAGHTLHQVRSLSSLRQQSRANSIDAIVCGDDLETLNHITKLFENQPITQTPLICVITGAPTPPTHTIDADIVLPNIPAPFIERILHRQIIIRREQIEHTIEQQDVDLLKNVLVQNVSHELRTPLLQVKSAVALIAEEDKDSVVPKMAVQATARLEAIIKNITLLSDSFNVTFGPVLIHESIEQAIRNLRRIWIHKYDVTRIVVDISDDVLPVIGDGQQIGIALQQLIENALKFSEADVYVSATNNGNGIKITVKDTGIGIPEDQFEQIFQPFYQVDSSITRPYSGIGLGLAIVDTIIRKHGVEIKVESRFGKGSTFSFILPEATLS